MLARGLTQADVAQQMGAHTSNVSRIMSGKLNLSPANRRTFARIFKCPEAAFLDRVGFPIPDIPMAIQSAQPDFDRRLKAIVAVFGPERLEGCLRFLASGDYAGLPPDMVRRLRKMLERIP